MEVDIGQVRLYGNSPRDVVVLHGGPGAAGEMQPVATELGKTHGVLEPFQTKDTVQGQVEELRAQIDEHTKDPVTLIGFSWGAWLGFLFSSMYNERVKKLILVSSAPFEESCASQIIAARISSLTTEERNRLEELEAQLKQPGLENRNLIFEEYGAMMRKADTYSSNQEERNYSNIKPDYRIYDGVWKEAAQLRKTGELLKSAKNIKCPVVAIHGDYDSHPEAGVRIPLSKELKNFKLYLLHRCGHYPWFESHAKTIFYDRLNSELD